MVTSNLARWAKKKASWGNFHSVILEGLTEKNLWWAYVKADSRKFWCYATKNHYAFPTNMKMCKDSIQVAVNSSVSGLILENKDMLTIFEKKGKWKGKRMLKRAKKGKIFEKLGKNVQNLKILWKRAGNCVR